jgi:hypothetical protein
MRVWSPVGGEQCAGRLSARDLLHRRVLPGKAALCARCLFAESGAGPPRPVATTLSGCGAAGITGIGQLADVPGGQDRDGGGVEIRIVLDRAEPPAGRLWVIGAARLARRGQGGREVSFTGWLGLLRALYEVTAEPGAGSRRGD